MATETPQTFKTHEDRRLGTNGLRIEKLFTKKLNQPYADIDWTEHEINDQFVFLPSNWSIPTIEKWSEALYPENVPQVDINGVELSEKGKEVLGSENSFRQVFDRVGSSFRWWGESFGYFHRKVDAQTFEEEVKYAISHGLIEFDMSHLKWAGLKYAYNLKAENSEGWYLDQDSNEVKSVKEKFSRPFLYQNLIISADQADLIQSQIERGIEVVVDVTTSIDPATVIEQLPRTQLVFVQISIEQIDLITKFSHINWQILISDFNQLTELTKLDISEAVNLRIQLNQFDYELINMAIPIAKLNLRDLSEIQQTQLIHLATICLDISTIMGKFPSPEIASNSSKYHSILIETDSNAELVRSEMLITSAEITKTLSGLPKQSHALESVREFASRSGETYANYIIEKYKQRLQALIRSNQNLAVYANELTELPDMIDSSVSQLCLQIKPVEQEMPAVAAMINQEPTETEPQPIAELVSKIVPIQTVTTPSIKNLNSLTHKFEINSHPGFLTLVTNDSHIKEIIIFMPKQNAAFNEMLNAICTGINLSLKAGVDLGNIVSSYSGMQFEPQGNTNNSAIPQVKSVIDYAMQFVSQTVVA